jgi:hypothetical protein
MNCKLVGRWRIVEADIWDRQYLDLCGPASIIIRANGRGEIAFGALQAGLDVEYSRASVGFTWEGFDEMDEGLRRRIGRIARRRLDRDRICLSQRRRSRSQAGHFFNSLLEAPLTQRRGPLRWCKRGSRHGGIPISRHPKPFPTFLFARQAAK